MTVTTSRYAKYSKHDARDGWQYTFWGMGAAMKVKKIELTAQTTAAETDTGWNLPAKSFVIDCWLEVRTAEATATNKTVDVGLLSSESGGNAAGFMNDVSVAATGLVKPNVTITTGGNETYISANTWGSLLYAGYVVGTNANGDFGLFVRRWHDTDSTTARSVSWTAVENQTEFEGDLYILYMEIGTHE